jgi:hypothetical protein
VAGYYKLRAPQKQRNFLKICCGTLNTKITTRDNPEVFQYSSFAGISSTGFFLLERPNLFVICTNTFSKWWEG